MSLNFDLKEIERRANYAAFQDGLTEIFMGLFLFFYGGSLATNTLPAGVVFILVTIFFGKNLIERIKKRYIYPRTGYVKLPEDPHTTSKGIGISALIMIVVLLGAMAISMAILGQNPGVKFFLTYIVPPASGFLLAIGPYWLGQTYGLRRGYIWAVLFVLGGIAMPVFSIASGYEAVGLLCTVMGLITLVTGSLMFLQFMRRNPPQSLDVDEVPHA
ncbi:MAG: hypothetical protein ISR58_20545 [Anaerolineales bacterium]|nr:hypothetical protein [Anaerolineales bacterium]